MTLLEQFLRDLHPTARVISRGEATVLDNTVPAAEVSNLYGQRIVWGVFNVDKGKFKGLRLANDANTDDVSYVADMPA